MTNPVPSFPEGHIEALAKLLDECGSGWDGHISRAARPRAGGRIWRIDDVT